jgi:hypothetical protein
VSGANRRKPFRRVRVAAPTNRRSPLRGRRASRCDPLVTGVGRMSQRTPSAGGRCGTMQIRPARRTVTGVFTLEGPAGETRVRGLGQPAVPKAAPAPTPERPGAKYGVPPLDALLEGHGFHTLRAPVFVAAAPPGRHDRYDAPTRGVASVSQPTSSTAATPDASCSRILSERVSLAETRRTEGLMGSSARWLRVRVVMVFG